jgi:GNAT superfamily N-acetyltransferase
VEVRALTTREYPQVLPLIADYQRFYRVEQPDPELNDAFFRRFLDPSDDGLLLGAWSGGELGGYACLYWTFSSVRPGEVVLLNDLFVRADLRGAGIGRRLIDASVDVARARGATAVRWWTELSNRPGQRLYERTPAARSAWFEYQIRLDG